VPRRGDTRNTGDPHGGCHRRRWRRRLEHAKAGPPPLPLRSPVGATDREEKETAQGATQTYSPREGPRKMATHDDTCASNASVSSGRKPDMTATAFSFTRQVIRSSSHSIHGNYLARHTVNRFPHVAPRPIPSNARNWISVPRPREKHELLVLKYPALRIVRDGNKQYRPGAASPPELFSNFFPFDTEPLGQWCGRRRHAPARMVPRIV
jgi:hypothetical protein